MALPPEELSKFQVSIIVDGSVIERATFATLEEAETFLELRTDEDPAASGVIDDGSVDHTAHELVELDTALPEDHERVLDDDLEDYAPVEPD